MDFHQLLESPTQYMFPANTLVRQRNDDDAILRQALVTDHPSCLSIERFQDRLCAALTASQTEVDRRCASASLCPALQVMPDPEVRAIGAGIQQEHYPSRPCTLV